eukprot:CAMPEP_0115104442 /NCGR_PEP_ID=MMETSP0227-20121206/35317_1 /TAXON_ID=89957 /ORGANISM="Polarella glacialis, Strain CCMP 1383" /LENGTH=43 /DNA_ID= /DNA_START= /DNA_END= /DNA_ORIENTATION=
MTTAEKALRCGSEIGAELISDRFAFCELLPNSNLMVSAKGYQQ